MRHKLIALGIISPLVLALCFFASVVLGVVGWLMFQPESPAQITKKITTIAPLFLPGPGEASTEQEAVSAIEEGPATAGTTEADPAAGMAIEPASTVDIEAALGFALPPNTVNSITQQGVASRIVIPKLKLDAPVMLSPIKDQTWDVSHLEQAVGHLEGTAPPGSSSNIVLAGHVTLAAGVYGPFAGLAQLTQGDLIVVYEGDQKFQYVIDGYQTVERTDVQVTHPTDTGQITLITCSNWNRDAERYEQRIIVKGHLLAE
jgi:LPXTG-site transpeptidase (sortase) family protein